MLSFQFEVGIHGDTTRTNPPPCFLGSFLGSFPGNFPREFETTPVRFSFPREESSWNIPTCNPHFAEVRWFFSWFILSGNREVNSSDPNNPKKNRHPKTVKLPRVATQGVGDLTQGVGALTPGDHPGYIPEGGLSKDTHPVGVFIVQRYHPTGVFTCI